MNEDPMDDRRMSERLRSTEVLVTPDRAFLDRTYALLADELGLPSATASGAATPAARPRGRWAAGWRHGRGLLVAAAALALALLALLLVLALQRPSQPLSHQRALEVVVRPDFPQVDIKGLAGFDIDVAEALAGRMHQRLELTPLAADAMLAGDRAWDVALPSRSVTASEASGAQVSAAYYDWPRYVVVPRDAAVATVADLAGRTVCAADAAGRAWLAGGIGDGTLIIAPPPVGAGVAADLTGDAACLDALAAGTADAMVTATLTRADLATRPRLEIVGDGPVTVEPRALLVASATSGIPDLPGRVATALASLRADGSLAALSRNRFGGDDLTNPPSASQP
jgi:ABC-type amino acid transport substrate-binding protein